MNKTHYKKVLDKTNNMSLQDKIVFVVFDTWKNHLKNNNNSISDDKLFDEINKNIKSGIKGIDKELSYLQIEFENYKEDYPQYENLDTIWQLLNHYKTHLEKCTKQETLIDEINNNFKL